MNWRFERLGFRFHIGWSRTVEVKGVNSELKDGYHFLMWDFDDLDEFWVYEDLWEIQEKHNLPTIYVLNTGLPNYWHAYCFHRCDWLEARAIIAGTRGVDRVFLTLGIMRGYFTLRISDKRGREFKRVFTIKSDLPETVQPEEVSSFVHYTTKRR